MTVVVLPPITINADEMDQPWIVLARPIKNL
jgi:hypothetical protein